MAACSAPCSRLIVGNHGAQAIAVLRRAVELGVDHIDTAQYYGPAVANELIRAALWPYDPALVLVSKVGARRDESGAWLQWDSPADLRQGIEDNLASLGVEQLGAVNLRLMGDDAPLEGPAGRGAGPRRRPELRRALQVTELMCVQNPLNVVDRSSLPALEECAARGIAFVPFVPFGSGFGVDNVPDEPAVVATAARLGATAPQVALAWLPGDPQQHR